MGQWAGGSLQPVFSLLYGSDRVYALPSKASEFLLDEQAVTSIEYALVAALIAMVCVAAVKTTGTNLSSLYTDVCNKVTEAISGAPAC
jgi:pilus assembly protein Flp/PilA